MNYKNHFIVFAFAFVLTFYSHAQIDKGTWMVGGNLSGSLSSGQLSDTSRNNTSYTRSYSILPQIGYFVTKNVLVGGSLGYSNFDNVSEYKYNYKSNGVDITDQYKVKNLTQSLQFGLLAGFYTPLNEWMYFNSFLKAAYLAPFYSVNQSKYTTNNIYNTEYDYTNDNTKQKSGTLSIELEPGISFFVTKKFALEASLSFLRYSYNFTSDSKSQSNGSNSGFDLTGFKFGINSISLGIRYFIPKRA